MRCTCERAVIEALEEVLAWDDARDWPMEYEYAYEGLLDHIREKIAARRAKAEKPVMSDEMFRQFYLRDRP